MTAAAHTPGPWTVAMAKRRFTGDEGHYRVKDAQGRTICQPYYNSLLSSEVDANARLIAAAPDLLAALQAVMGGQIGGSPDMQAERFQQARAAIARATGAA